ncbi:MAG TPA: TIGR03936 family radical SAM-associated protein [Microlunatus sp.]
MSPRTQPEQHPPPVQWLRLRYARRGRARFTSHRDFSRAFERALRRAQVPMAYSSGFSPHPRISYANAAPTGAASEAEFLEIGLTVACDPERVRADLDSALPAGLDIVAAQVAPGDTLADRLTGSRWQIDVLGVEPAVAERAVAAFLARDQVEVSRMTKSGLRTFDARAAVRGLRLEPGRLIATIAHQVPLVRPDDLLAALVVVEPAWQPPHPPLLTRLVQGALDESSGDITAPL